MATKQVLILVLWMTAGLGSAGCSSARCQTAAKDGLPLITWPGNQSDYATGHCGVWVDDFIDRPSDAELLAFRERYWRGHAVITFTLVEGEQLAPLGKNGKMIRVKAHAFAAGEMDYSEPWVSVWPVDSDELSGGPLDTSESFSPAVLPLEISKVIEKSMGGA